MNHTDGVLDALRQFAEAVRSTSRAAAPGDPESQLIAPARQLFETVGRLLGRRTIVAETPLGGLGQPDCCVEDLGVWGRLRRVEGAGQGGPWERFRTQPAVPTYEVRSV